MSDSISYCDYVTYRKNILFSAKITYIYKLLFDLSNV
jgi:hypothetical protein